MRRTTRLLALCIWFVAIATTASAQQSVPPSTAKWEVSVHLGAMVSTSPSGGTFTPPPRATLPLATGGVGPRVSSWFFADGAQLLNDVNAQVGVGARVTPLDNAFASSLTHAPGTIAFEFRAARSLSPKVTAEITFGYSPTGTRASDSLAGRLTETRTSFANAVRPLLAAGPNAFPGIPTTSSGVRPGSGGRLTTIGALKVALTSGQRVTPFVVAGAGIESWSGERPTASVTGNYRLSYGFPECLCQLNESDHVQLRVAVPSRNVVGMFGVGLDFQPAVRFWRGRAENRSRWGIRIEARTYLSPSTSETFVDTHPSFVPGQFNEDAPPDYGFTGVLVRGASPAAQFSNGPEATGFESSLSGEPLTDFRVFEGDGMRTRVAVTTGLFVRF